jgi:AAA+ ATPase superfamily predicted ATPase
MFRARELRLATASLRDGISLLVEGWRRIGKSSLVVETHRPLDKGGRTVPILIDV